MNFLFSVEFQKNFYLFHKPPTNMTLIRWRTFKGVFNAENLCQK